jgi:ubiquinone/menaquinone biosynthesis C-methylase UbiE
MTELTQPEQITSIVFGDTFALYSDEEFEEFIEFLRTRLRANDISLDAFKGKRCFDAGCGGGRATILMAEAGASEVVAFDLSDTNVATTRMRAEQRGLDNVTVVQGSLLDIPYESESFDVVWSNGVLHHTGDTDGSLLEFARLCKPGGWMWLYLYGSGGISWHLVDWVRETLKDVHVSEVIAHLRLQGVEVRRIAEWIDDWKVPVLQRYTREDVRRRLVELGFAEAQPLDMGTHFDTSQRRVGASGREVELMGDGDVRYWCQKTAEADPQNPLPEAPDGKGSFWDDGEAVLSVDPSLDRITEALERLEAARGDAGGAYRIMVSSRVHTAARTLVEGEGELDLDELTRRLDAIAELCDAFARLET